MGKRKNKMKVVATATPEVEKKYSVKANSLTSTITRFFSKDKETPPVVYYSNRAWQKMKRAIAICTQEVGWLGTVDVVEDGYIITDIFIPEQTVTGAETDISADSLAQLMVDQDYPENLYYWGHSHVNMGVGPSGQDDSQTSEYLEHNDVFIRGIYNKKGDSKVDVYDMKDEIVYQAVKNGVRIEPLSDEELEAFDKVVKENVKARTYQNNHRSAGNWGANHYGGSGRQSNSMKSNSVYSNPFVLRIKGGKS